MTTIWKTVLAKLPLQLIEVPAGAEMLCAREQYNEMCVWYRCDPGSPKEPRTIAICGTGHPAPEAAEARYLGTCALNDGTFQFHVFEKIAP